MVVCNIAGGLGNQMFQIAAAAAYAKRHGLELHVPTNKIDSNTRPPQFPHLVNAGYDPGLMNVVIQEPHFHYKEIPFREEWRGANIQLRGYWQSARFFHEMSREQLLSIFGLSLPDQEEDRVALQYRLGDYKNLPLHHPIISDGYLEAAFENLERQKYLVFSDEPDLAQQRLSKFGLDLKYSRWRQPIEDLLLMSCCKHVIMSASSFGWWGAWLGHKPGRKVIAPKNWFGPALPHNTKDLYEPDWIII